MLSIQLDQKTEERLASRAAKCGQTASGFALAAITDALAEWEDVEIAVERIKKPGTRYSMDEVERMLGLDD